MVYLQLGLGLWHRAALAEGEIRARSIRAPRGSICAADGTVLAQDRCDADLAVHYRFLERPTDRAWLDRQARERLSRKDRRDPARLAESREAIEAEIRQTWHNLAELSGMPEQELDRRAAVVQQRVNRIVDSVNARRLAQWERERTGPAPAQTSLTMKRFWSAPALRNLCQWLADEPVRNDAAPEPVAVLEQLRYFTLVENIPSDVLLKFTSSPELYPGVRLEQQVRRAFPQRELACAVVGYTGSAESEDEDSSLSSGHGVAGIEGYYDAQLRGEPGSVREQVVSPGGVAKVLGGRPPRRGQDIVLTIDLALQELAEKLLEQAMSRAPAEHTLPASSGAVLVMDAWTGAVLVAASAPRFDANLAARPDTAEGRKLANDADSPLFSRVQQMAIPPGSSFKPVIAMAALKNQIDPQAPYFCRGYLHRPDKFRCLVFRNFGIGHEAVTLQDALVRSCNVYFFQLAERIGWDEMVRWGQAFGFGQKTGIDLAGEEAGEFPTLGGREPVATRNPPETDRLGLAIGQGPVLATPVQLAVMMAAIANGGQRVVPHLRRDAFQPPRPIDRIDSSGDPAMGLIRAALELVVADPHGTGFEHIRMSEIRLAGKTGTAQSGSQRGDHAWFAGYLPADQPRYAIVVTLEHAGSGGHATGPLIRNLVRGMIDQGHVHDLEPAVPGLSPARAAQAPGPVQH